MGGGGGGGGVKEQALMVLRQLQQVYTCPVCRGTREKLRAGRDISASETESRFRPRQRPTKSKKTMIKTSHATDIQIDVCQVGDLKTNPTRLLVDRVFREFALARNKTDFFAAQCTIYILLLLLLLKGIFHRSWRTIGIINNPI